jgi:hypothetical protein
LAGPAYSLDKGAAELAPLGWSSWNALKGSFTEATLRAQADAMVRSGMQGPNCKVRVAGSTPRNPALPLVATVIDGGPRGNFLS